MYGLLETPQDLLMLNIISGTTLWMLLMNWMASSLMVRSVESRWPKVRGTGAAATEENDDDPGPDQILEIADEDLDPAQIPEIESDPIVDGTMMKKLLVPRKRKVDGIDRGQGLILGLGKILGGRELIVDRMKGEDLSGIMIEGVGLLAMILGIDRRDISFDGLIKT